LTLPVVETELANVDPPTFAAAAQIGAQKNLARRPPMGSLTPSMG